MSKKHVLCLARMGMVPPTAFALGLLTLFCYHDVLTVIHAGPPLSHSPGALVEIRGPDDVAKAEHAESVILIDPPLATMKELVRLAKASRIIVSGAEVDRAHIQGLVMAPNLAELEFRGCTATPDWGVLIGLQACNRLRGLTINASSGISDSTILSISKLAELERLRLNNLQDVSRNGFEPIAALTRLDRLVLEADGVLGDESTDFLKPLKALRELTLVGCRLGSASLGIISSCAPLEVLTLHTVQDVKDADVAKLAKLARLGRLSLSVRSGVTDSAVVAILSAPSLESLSLGYSEDVKGTFLKELGRAKRLRAFQLGFGPHGAFDPKHWADVPLETKFEEINVLDGAASVQLLEAARKWPCLRSIAIGDASKLTEKDIRFLIDFKVLEECEIARISRGVPREKLESIAEAVRLHRGDQLRHFVLAYAD